MIDSDEIQNVQPKPEIKSRMQTDKCVKTLTKELKSAKARLTSYKKNMDERIQFDVLFSEISTFFINLPSDQVDKEIESAQQRICECLGLDMSVLWQCVPDKPDEFVLTHLFRPVSDPPVPKRMSASEYVPWFIQQAMAGKIVAVSSIKDAPAGAARDMDTWRYYGVNTTLDLPLRLGNGTPFGVISFNDMKLKKREWTPTLLSRLKLVAQVFANAISRKRFEENLRKSEQRLDLATSAAGTGLWTMNTDTQEIWGSEKLRELLCFDSETELTYRSFMGKIHPDDRGRVDDAVKQSLRSETPLNCDYRIVLPNDSIRWVCARGRLKQGADGTPDLLMGVSTDITGRITLESKLKSSLQEIEKLTKRLERENLYLQQEINLLSEQGEIIGKSLAIKRVMQEADQVASTGSTVLILGETGTGKEMVARAIHQMSNLKNHPMVTINCASLPPSLIESELFGREKGAYTGALTKMVGRFELADNSTLFLDEIGELPVEVQGKLLRVLEEGVFERLGSTKPIHVNARIIAATNRDIENEVSRGNFRSDLFYRLNVFPIKIPPLRERAEDIPMLVWAFVKKYKQQMGKDIEIIPKKTMDALQSYVWPGNVRELRNVIENAMILSHDATLLVDLPRFQSKEKKDVEKLEDLERRHIVSVLKKTGWRVGGNGGASEILGLKRPTLYSKMKKLGISRPRI